MPDFEVAIVGGGVVGLGIAVRVAHGVDSVALFERHETWGREISSRNSEVVHSGIYAHEPAAPGFINLCGIESPGLTSSLAIGDCVAEMAAAFLG